MQRDSKVGASTLFRRKGVAPQARGDAGFAKGHPPRSPFLRKGEENRTALIAPGRKSKTRPLESRHSRGFTLLEVLAAIALLVIAFAVGLGALGKSAQNAARSAALDTAVEHAQSLLAEQGLAAPLKDETLSGTFDDGMRWSLKIHALPRPAAAANGADGAAVLQQGGVMMAQATGIDLYQLDVAVSYGANRTLRLATQRVQAASEADR
ncbi:MAG: prepilin-type N-terminal cleavage/methylation domain-containing protein [Rhodanobacteraceae bacterium]|nr:MAG: prepilin-type N-terminal cleavage/methylation domain-containing protein [Rhodanobacteraceae bacterium]